MSDIIYVKKCSGDYLNRYCFQLCKPRHDAWYLPGVGGVGGREGGRWGGGGLGGVNEWYMPWAALAIASLSFQVVNFRALTTLTSSLTLWADNRGKNTDIDNCHLMLIDYRLITCVSHFSLVPITFWKLEYDQAFILFLYIVHLLFSSTDPKVSSAELMVLLICPSSVVRRPSSSVVRPSTFALNRYSSYSSYSIILNFLLEKLGL